MGLAAASQARHDSYPQHRNRKRSVGPRRSCVKFQSQAVLDVLFINTTTATQTTKGGMNFNLAARIFAGERRERYFPGVHTVLDFAF